MFFCLVRLTVVDRNWGIRWIPQVSGLHVICLFPQQEYKQSTLSFTLYFSDGTPQGQEKTQSIPLLHTPEAKGGK